MPESSHLVWLIAAVLIGLVLGVLLLLALRPGWLRSAHARGAASRDAELVALAGQRDALDDRLVALVDAHDVLQRQLAEVGQRLYASVADAASRRSEAEQLSLRLAEQRRAGETMQARLESLLHDHAELKASSTEKENAATAKLALLDQAEVRLRESFQNLAQQILDAKAERLREQSSEQLGNLLDPLRTQLREFRDAAAQIHAVEQRERGVLAEQIRTLKDLNQRISEDAVSLTRALKGDNRAQGAWGELVLERVLEASGLESGREYETQVSHVGEDGERQRPDVIVHLPEEKDIVIDAKVSLVAWERAVSATDDEQRVAAMRDHVASLRRHVELLSGKRYDGIKGLRTLDFVLMFIPIEAAFIEAVRHDAGLYAHALGRNVSLVSPSTLLATLRTVSHLWRIERRNVNAMEIARRAAQLHDNFVQLALELETVGSQIDKAQAMHGRALRRLTDGGKGSVVLQVKSLADLGAPARKEIPRSLLAESGLDTPTGEADPSMEDGSG